MRILDVDLLIQEIDPSAPCGPNLEYDPEFLELEQAVLGKPEVQYGSTITPAVPPEWKAVKRTANNLLARSRDLRLTVPLLRAMLALDGISGMADCLRLIDRLLDERWDSVHPQLDPDDDFDPALRINSLAVLNDAATVLREVREATIVVLPGLGPISVRDLEIATGERPAPAGYTKLSMTSIEAALKDVEPSRLMEAVRALSDAFDWARNIEIQLVRRVGSSQALNLDAITRMLARGRDVLSASVVAEATRAEAEVETAEIGEVPVIQTRTSDAATSGEIRSREDVLRMLDKICSYYQRYEPSSPVPLLLERTKRIVPMTFMEVIKELAPDSISQVVAVSGIVPE